MESLDEFLQDILKRHPDAERLRITRQGTNVSVQPFADAPIDLRARAKEFKLPLHKGRGYIAVSQWDLRTDTTSYYVVRT
jgi:hypothetical protein